MSHSNCMRMVPPDPAAPPWFDTGAHEDGRRARKSVDVVAELIAVGVSDVAGDRDRVGALRPAV